MTRLARIRSASSYLYWLTVIPFLAFIVGVVFVNRVHPMIFGMPLILGWIVIWIPLTAMIMAGIYLLDPANIANVKGADE